MDEFIHAFLDENGEIRINDFLTTSTILGNAFKTSLFILEGKKDIPLHYHADTEELHIVLSGVGVLQVKPEYEQANFLPIHTGSVFFVKPTDSHRVSNLAEEQLVIMIIATHNPADAFQG